MKKKLCLWLLAMGLPVSGWCADGDTFTAETTEGVTVTFKVLSESGKTCQVGDGSMACIDKTTTGSLTIPESISGYSITAIGYNAFDLCKNLTSIILPNSITSVGGYGFSGCENLTSITLPDNITYIERGTFAGCISLHSVDMPDNLIGIEQYAFESCSSLATVTIPNSVTYIESNAFYGCSNMASINIGSGVKSIGEKAFMKSGLVSIEVPSNVTTIQSYAFSECTSLKSASLSSGLSSIMGYTFKGCTSLTSVEFPNTLKSIGGSAFYGCSSLASAVIPNSVYSIGSYAFSHCAAMVSATLPNSITKIDENVFEYCSALESAIIPDNVTTISACAFMLCSKLSAVKLSSSLESIGMNAFVGCKFSTVTIPESVKNISTNAFGANLESITFGHVLPSMSGAFNSCTKLADVYYPAAAYKLFNGSSILSSYTLHPQITLSNEWNTYCATGSFDVPDGVEAYVAKSYAGGVITLEKVNTINEGQGVLLKPEETGIVYEATLNSSPIAYDSNLLKGVTTATTIGATDGDYTNFIFTTYNGRTGFFKTSGGTFPAYKAYLQLPTADLPAGASELSFVIDNGNTTAIQQLSGQRTSETEWYTLSGVRIPTPTQKGIYINHGKKIYLK